MQIQYKMIAVLSLVASGAFAQSVAGLGAVTGTVRDASGAVVPGATVVLSNELKGIKRTLQTTDAGVFAAPALVPSDGYSISVTKSGFANWDVKQFRIQVGQTVDFKADLKVSGTATTVQVTSQAALVDDTKTGVSDVVTQSQIDNLPINGRRADTFALVSPAATTDGTFGLVSFRGVVGSNSFLTDGNDTTDSFYQENAGRTRISTQISQDAVQEFQVMSDGFSAEFGQAMGGVINTVTRSGTNDYHGTAYWFFRNRTLNAPDRYAAGYNPPEYRHQAGASFGGPIKKDKLFFFSNFELIDRNFPGINKIINTTFTDTAGNIIPSKCTASAAQCAAAINFINAQTNGASGVQVPRSVNSYMGFTKIDWRPSERNTFSIDMNAMHWRSPDGIQTQGVLTNGNMLGGNGNSTVETRYGKASWTAVRSSNAVNELRFGWFKDRLSDPAASQLWPSTGPLGLFIGSSAIGAAQAYPRTFPSEQRFQLVDNYSWTHGAHTTKFGADFETTEDWINQLYNGAGTYNYSSLTNFALDFNGGVGGNLGCMTNGVALPCYSTFTQEFGNPIQDMRTTDLGLYAQDVWKLTKRFTLNYGLRYEKSILPQPTVSNPAFPQTGFVNSPNKDFAPRISLSYALDDKTVVRAGYGIYYARFLGDAMQELFIGNGLYQTSISVNPNQAGAPIFPNIVAPGTVPAGTSTIEFAAPNFRDPYTQQGTLAVERQLRHDMDLTVSYLWSHGVQLWTARDLNLAGPTTTETYTIDNAAGTPVGTYTTPIYTSKVFPAFGHVYQAENGGQSWYNGLAIQLRKRMSHGLSAQVSYTWSHAIDDAAQTGAGSTGVLYLQQPNTFDGNYAADKGSSGTDQRHRAVINFIWQPTFVHGTSAFDKYLINGWELSAITTLASAQPTSPTISVSGQQFTAGGGPTMAYNTTLNGSGGWNRVPFLPVDSLDVDRVYRVDARLARSIPINERFKAYLMFEAFNAFNTQYNTGVNTTAYTASNGVLKPVAGLGVGNQSQAFPDGTNARRCQAAFRLVF